MGVRLYPSRAQQWQLATCSSSARTRTQPAPLAAGRARRPRGPAVCHAGPCRRRAPLATTTRIPKDTLSSLRSIVPSTGRAVIPHGWHFSCSVLVRLVGTFSVICCRVPAGRAGNGPRLESRTRGVGATWQPGAGYPPQVPTVVYGPALYRVAITNHVSFRVFVRPIVFGLEINAPCSLFN